jgi:hypothetical protein
MDVATLGIRVDANGAITVLDQFGKKVDSVDAKTSGFEKTVKRLGAVLGAGLIGHKFLRETIMAQDAMADLEAAVRSSGGSAGKTLKELDALSFAMQRTTRFSDEAAKNALTMLLTFDKIDGSQMERAALAAANLATRMKGDLAGAAQMVGKSLQDPAQGVAMIQRQFRLFNEEQLATIKRMQDMGQHAKAQEMVFTALEAKFKNAAAASRNTLGGALDYVKNVFGDLFEVSSGGTDILVKGLNAAGGAMERLQPYMGKIIALAVAGTSAWLAYKAALMGVAIWQGVVGATQTIMAFIQLAKAIRTAADAAALFSMVGGGIVKVAAVVAAMTIGWLAYKKVLEQVNKETESFLKNLPTPGDGPPDGPDESKLMKDIKFQNAERVRLAEQELGLVGKRGLALEKEKNLNESINEYVRIAHERGLSSTLELDEATMKSVRTARLLKDQTAAARIESERLAKVWDTMVQNIQGALADAFNNVFTEGIRSFQTFVDTIKAMFFRMVSELLASQVMRKLIEAVGGKDGSLGSQQVKAGMTMLTAAQLQVQAANTMAGITGTPTTGVPGNAGKGINNMIGGATIGLAGLGVGYGLGRSIGGTGGVIAGAVGGAATGAALGSTVLPGIGTAVGAVVGGLAGLVGGLLGSKKAAKEAAEQQRLLAEAYKQFTNGVKVTLGLMSPLAASIDQVKKEFTDARKALGFGTQAEFEKAQAAMKKFGLNLDKDGKLASQYKELAELEALRIVQLQQEAAQIKKWAAESIEVRFLEASGRSKEAAALRLQVQHEQEYNDAIKQGLDAATLARLKEVQALEKVKAASDAFTSSALNIPSGYKVAQAMFRAMSPNDPWSPTPGTRAPRPRENQDENLAVTLVMDGEVVAKGVVKKLQGRAARQTGNPANWAQVTIT